MLGEQLAAPVIVPALASARRAGTTPEANRARMQACAKVAGFYSSVAAQAPH